VTNKYKVLVRQASTKRASRNKREVFVAPFSFVTFLLGSAKEK
jgi:hypothetical protein